MPNNNPEENPPQIVKKPLPIDIPPALRTARDMFPDEVGPEGYQEIPPHVLKHLKDFYRNNKDFLNEGILAMMSISQIIELKVNIDKNIYTESADFRFRILKPS